MRRFPASGARLSRLVAAGAATLLAAAPLFSISGVRPLSDMPGLALALLAQALIVRGIVSPPWLIAGAFAAGLSGGIRVQSALLTAPLLLGVLVGARRGHTWTHRALAVAAGAAGGLAWGVPLLILSGGLQAYLRALGSQAGEDFAWVDMLWANPTPRLLALALYRTLALAWGDPRLGFLVAGLAAAGFVVACVRTRRMLAVLCLAFVPYAVFHLLLQETVTIRYALPLLPPVVWLATTAIAWLAGLTTRLARPVFVAGCAAVAASGALVSIPTLVDYGMQAHPAFRALDDMASEAEALPPAALYSDYAVYRAVQAAAPASLNPVPPVRQKEWLGPVEFFRRGGTQTVWFLGDPLRTDMALFDPASVGTGEQNPWRPLTHPELGGVRPAGAVWHRLSPPGWMAGEGWSLTPEAGGRVRASRTGLDHGDIEAYVRRRPEPSTLVIGGFHLGAPADADAELTVSIDGVPVEAWIVPGRAAGQPFVRFVRLPRGVAAGARTVRHAARVGTAARARPARARDRDPAVRPAARGRPSADGLRRRLVRGRIRARDRPAVALDRRACAIAVRLVTNGRAARPRRVAREIRRRRAHRADYRGQPDTGHVPPRRRLLAPHHRARRCVDRGARRRHDRNRSHVSARRCGRHRRYAAARPAHLRMPCRSAVNAPSSRLTGRSSDVKLGNGWRGFVDHAHSASPAAVPALPRSAGR